MSGKQKQLAVLRGRIRPPRLSVAKGSTRHWTRRLDKFRVKHDLSERDMVDVLGGVWGKSYMHEVLSGAKQPQREEMIKPFIEARLRMFLRETKKLGKLAIEREIREIFNYSSENDQEVESVITQRSVLPRKAQTFFGLSRDPFTGDPHNHREVFTTPYMDKLLAKIEDAINYQHFVAVIGDVGAGKLILKRRIEKICTDSRGKMVLLWPKFPNMEVVHSGSICSFILRSFEESNPRDRVMRAQAVEKLLMSLSGRGIRVALGFDECHRLDPRLLTALKNFYEMGSGGFDRYLGLILLGQPKFQTTLNYPEYREITERINVLRLGYQDKKTPNLGRFAWDYVAHRLKSAGGNVDKLFDRQAVSALAQIGDTPQALGNLCNAALTTAFELNVHKVHNGILKSAGLLSEEQRIRVARA